MEVVNCFYNRRNINVLAIIIALLIVFIISSLIKETEEIKNIEIVEDTKILSANNDKNLNKIEEEYDNRWRLEIEKIGLMAEIQEGTDEETLENFIGHFSSTPVKIGNVALAAHNRGYKNNYFSKLKELEIGDNINYYINGNKFIYEVSEIIVIYETDWSMLENTKDNRITMITCIENREKYRLCVQAIRVKEE